MISMILLTIGLSLMIMGVRFTMVRNSLLAGKPSDTRLDQLKREFWVCAVAGVLVYVIGLVGSMSVEQRRAIAITGATLFSLGVPQHLQWNKGLGDINKSAKTIKS